MTTKIKSLNAASILVSGLYYATIILLGLMGVYQIFVVAPADMYIGKLFSASLCITALCAIMGIIGGDIIKNMFSYPIAQDDNTLSLTLREKGLLKSEINNIINDIDNVVLCNCGGVNVDNFNNCQPLLYTSCTRTLNGLWELTYHNQGTDETVCPLVNKIIGDDEYVTDAEMKKLIYNFEITQNCMANY